MKLYSMPGGAFQIAVADDGILVQDIQCAGNSQGTAALLANIGGNNGPDIRKIEVLATWVGASDFAVSLIPCPPKTSVEIWAKAGPVTVFPDGFASGASFGSGAASVMIPQGTGKLFKQCGNSLTPVWNYTA